MSEVKMIATRDSYGAALVELGKSDPNLVVLDADLSAATKTGTFKKAFPDRFINAGIAEGNMMSVAAGLATTGKTVFASSFAMFAAGRAFEQVRNSIGYPHLNVKIGATHAGISVGEDGATHQCCEDIALMRSIPGMTILNPADDTEARKAVFAAAAMNGPVYLRFGRLAVPVLFDNDYPFAVGKGVQLVAGNDVTIVATGLLVSEALIAAEQLKNEGIAARVPFKGSLSETVYQLIAFFTAEQEKRIMKVLSHCESTRWNPLFTDIVPLGSSKRVGIDKMLEHYHIGLDECMAFGDGGNDIQMLSHVGIGVAMGNAAEDVMSAASYVTTSVDENGVYNALKHFNII